ncbi:WW domain-binding protein 11-like isoform X1 [Gallus gallus]|uniref:WW domain-binding protein 11-like isoform X1 n=1 Tax=Gallus gallus TaxID=9031 RepID=UPI000D63F52B|nr:WW domain-binding protein 11-like isoform X1 [Gallus gallus]|eukprot:XP_024997811.1 WW domain-binding protein 11-like [Gallus gallus]
MHRAHTSPRAAANRRLRRRRPPWPPRAAPPPDGASAPLYRAARARGAAGRRLRPVKVRPARSPGTRCSGVSESICSARPPPPAVPGRFPPRLRSPPPEPRVPGARLAPPERCPRRDAGLIAAPLSARHRAAPLLRLVRRV